MTFGWITGNAGVAGHQYQSSQSIDSDHFSQSRVLVVRSGSGSPESEEFPISSTSAMWGEGFPRGTKVPCPRYGIV
jgi:hypothetical protein